jgi:response regulator RpfG family c-di-GMP phosphodiesterase
MKKKSMVPVIPMGLRCQVIMLEARIIAVADVVEAMSAIDLSPDAWSGGSHQGNH